MSFLKLTDVDGTFYDEVLPSDIIRYDYPGDHPKAELALVVRLYDGDGTWEERSLTNCYPSIVIDEVIAELTHCINRGEVAFDFGRAIPQVDSLNSRDTEPNRKIRSYTAAELIADQRERIKKALTDRKNNIPIPEKPPVPREIRSQVFSD